MVFLIYLFGRNASAGWAAGDAGRRFYTGRATVLAASRKFSRCGVTPRWFSVPSMGPRTTQVGSVALAQRLRWFVAPADRRKVYGRVLGDGRGRIFRAIRLAGVT
jgi:hypothetical protein